MKSLKKRFSIGAIRAIRANSTGQSSGHQPHVAKGACLFAVLLATGLCSGQGALHITFDGPPLQPPGSAFTVQQYFEGGMWFRALPNTDGFGRSWTNRSSLWPNNGTPHLDASAFDSLAFDFENGSLFGVVSVDLAGYSTVVPDFTVNFVGYRTDGSTIATSFSGTGIDFRTVYFGPDWSSGLTRVEIPNFGWSLDNLVVSIPEPGTAALLVFGALAFGCWRMKRRRQL